MGRVAELGSLGRSTTRVVNTTSPEPVRERIKIYGLFDRQTGRCYYVGQTRWTRKREQQHFNPFRGHARLVPNAEFRVLRDVLDHEDPKDIERQVIADYKAKGEATLNSDRPPENYRTSAYYQIQWVERDVVFAGFGQAGRALGCTPQTVANHFRTGSRRVSFSDGVTLVLRSWPSYFTPND